MPSPLHRMPVQLAHLLREEIAKGTWIGALPGERTLAEKFQASRKTVRAALRTLRTEGTISTRRGAGSDIRLSANSRAAVAQAHTLSVGLLLPRPLAELRQHTTLWINRLADILQRMDGRLTVFSGKKYFANTGHRQLASLTRSNPQSCWLVAHSTRFVQNWFEDSGLPTVITGSLHPGVSLPSVDIDHVALCRHAAISLLRAGHRRIALLYPKTDRAGDIESEEGFRQGCLHFGAAPAPIVVQHEDSPDSVYAATTRLLKVQNPPTALLVSSSTNYLTVASCLAAHGKRIPADISVISRDEDAFLHHLVPIPDRYYVDPDKYAQQVRQAILAALQPESAARTSIRIMPEYRRGASVSAPA